MLQASIVLIGGPTASGKSALALRLAREKNGNVINADAMQVYAELPVLTAQPGIKDKAEISHLLYEVMDPSESSSAGKWLALARTAIAKTRAEGRIPIVVGGTGLYFEALTKGLADIPSVPDNVRNEAQRLYADWGEEKFRSALARRDPDSAARIASNDKQRLIRAFEVVEHTGKTLGDWHKSGGASGAENAVERRLVLPPRDKLYEACDRRFRNMIDGGALDEVRRLLERNLSPDLPAMKILGVREIAAFLRKEMSLEDAVSKAQQHTRNYAKRQMTWFRNRWPKETITENFVGRATPDRVTY